MKEFLRLIVLALFIVSLGLFLWLLADAMGLSGHQYPGEEVIGPGLEFLFSLVLTGLLGVIFIALSRGGDKHE